LYELREGEHPSESPLKGRIDFVLFSEFSNITKIKLPL